MSEKDTVLVDCFRCKHANVVLKKKPIKNCTKCGFKILWDIKEMTRIK